MKNKPDEKQAVESAKTRKIILEAAAALFVQKGFDGASISEIAKKADINQSLIYHYFDSKNGLWKSVKGYLVESCVDIKETELDPSLGLKRVFEQIVNTRFEFFEKNPDLMRMMCWQRLEAVNNDLVGGTRFSPDKWKSAFSYLQKKREIRAEVDLDLMILFITSVIAGALTEDHLEQLKNSKIKSHYINMIVDCFARSFG